MRKQLRDKGFTVVELAIVLVIIGLMLGAVLKGQSMIDDAKLKRLLNDLQGISAAYYTYYGNYNAIPGDDKHDHGWAGVAPATGGGAGDGLINGDNLIDGTEAHEAWQAIRYSGLLTGDPAETGSAHLPGNPFGGKYYIGSRNFGTGEDTKNYIMVNAISGSVAETVDIRFDDGVFSTGGVQGSAAYTSDAVDLYYGL